MKKTIKIYVTIIILLASVINPQNSGMDLLEDLQAKFNTIDDLTAEFTQSSNGKNILSGIFLFKKENKLKIDAKQIIIVSNGTTSWNYNKKENKVIISNHDESNPGVFSIKNLVYGLPAESNISAQMENGQRVLTLIPNSYTYNFDSVKLWLSDDNMISKVLLSDSALGRTEVIFSSYSINHNLPDSEFSFIPPEGSKVIDLR
jgi:outer membrane lipoprotein-sorting protein